MRPSKKEEREAKILDAAARLLATQGYSSTSMLSIAKETDASNQTLYRWYGSKEALFSLLIKRKAAETARELAKSVQRSAPLQNVLTVFGTTLITILSAQDMVLLHRAAAQMASQSDLLSNAIAEMDRVSVRPQLMVFFERAREANELEFDDLEQAVDVFLTLLVGDIPFNCTLGLAEPLHKSEAKEHAARAVTLFLKLFGAP